MPVDSRRKDYDDVMPKWRRLRDCYKGRDAVLKAGELYVPALPGVEVAGNVAYRERGNFYNAVKRTIHGLVGVIFQKAPEVVMPENLKVFLDDVTMTNITFEMFAVDAGQEAMLMGRFGVLVDMAAIESPTNRPYLCSYKAEDIINWRTTRVGGDEILTMIVLRESVDVPKEKDPFTADCVTQYRVCELLNDIYVQQLWREPTYNSKEFATYGPPLIPTRRGVPLNFIPFVFMGSSHATAEVDDPPLADLADVNLGHWRNSVDYEYGLHLVALPTPWVSGSKSPGGSTEKMKIGPSVVWELDIQGSAGMLEFTGEGLKSLVAAMDEKKKQMAVLGARLLEDVPNVDETATAVTLRRGGEHASLRTVANALEQAMTMLLQIVVWWQTAIDAPLDADAEVELNKEYFSVKISSQDVTAALASLQAGEISFETWWNLLTTGGWGREGVDATTEQDAIALDKSKKPEPVVVVPPMPLKPGDPGYKPPVGAAA